jgi:hypothetical protein
MIYKGILVFALRSPQRNPQQNFEKRPPFEGVLFCGLPAETNSLSAYAQPSDVN